MVGGQTGGVHGTEAPAERRLVCPLQGKANNKKGARRRFRPHVTAMVEHRLPGERESESQSAVLSRCNERFEQPAANAGWNSGPCVFYFDQHTVVRLLRADADLSALRHRLDSVNNQVKEYTLHARARQQHLYTAGYLVRDLNAVFFGGW